MRVQSDTGDQFMDLLEKNCRWKKTMTFDKRRHRMSRKKRDRINGRKGDTVNEKTGK